MCEETHLLGKRFRIGHIFINPTRSLREYFVFIGRIQLNVNVKNISHNFNNTTNFVLMYVRFWCKQKVTIHKDTFKGFKKFSN